MTRMLRAALSGAIGEDEAALAYSAFDQIGHVIIVRVPDGLRHRRAEIGRALLAAVKPATTVYAQSSDVTGEHRTRGLELIAGADEPVTVYVEHGCRIEVDVREAFFSPRLSTERQRVAAAMSDGETVLNMFGGVGAFSIVAAMARKCTVYSVDVNPTAARLCEANAARNARRMAGRVVSVLGDAREVAASMFGAGAGGPGNAEGEDGRPLQADRTLMLLPERSDEFLADAVGATADGGTIHYYAHVHADKKAGAPAEAERRFRAASPARAEVVCSKVVRAVGPRYYQAVVDAVISK